MNYYPVILDVKRRGGGMEVRASTSLARAFENAKTLQAELQCIEMDYRMTLAAVKEALASAKRGRFHDPRAFWFAGRCLADFMRRLESHGFYLVGKNATPARHLGISRASVGKMTAFYKRYPDPFKIDMTIPWSVYRDNREGRRLARV